MYHDFVGLVGTVRKTDNTYPVFDRLELLALLLIKSPLYGILYQRRSAASCLLLEIRVPCNSKERLFTLPLFLLPMNQKALRAACAPRGEDCIAIGSGAMCKWPTLCSSISQKKDLKHSVKTVG